MGYHKKKEKKSPGREIKLAKSQEVFFQSFSSVLIIKEASSSNISLSFSIYQNDYIYIFRSRVLQLRWMYGLISFKSLIMFLSSYISIHVDLSCKELRRKYFRMYICIYIHAVAKIKFFNWVESLILRVLICLLFIILILIQLGLVFSKISSNGDV